MHRSERYRGNLHCAMEKSGKECSSSPSKCERNRDPAGIQICALGSLRGLGPHGHRAHIHYELVLQEVSVVHPGMRSLLLRATVGEPTEPHAPPHQGQTVSEAVFVTNTTCTIVSTLLALSRGIYLTVPKIPAHASVYLYPKLNPPPILSCRKGLEQDWGLLHERVKSAASCELFLNQVRPKASTKGGFNEDVTYHLLNSQREQGRPEPVYEHYRPAGTKLGGGRKRLRTSTVRFERPFSLYEERFMDFL